MRALVFLSSHPCVIHRVTEQVVGESDALKSKQTWAQIVAGAVRGCLMRVKLWCRRDKCGTGTHTRAGTLFVLVNKHLAGGDRLGLNGRPSTNP